MLVTYDDNNLLRKRKELIHELKLNVKTLMEYASVCRSIPEDSTHVISFCTLVHECLRIGLKTSPFSFYQNISTYSLLHKISNQCETSLKIINKFENRFNEIENSHSNNSEKFNNNSSNIEWIHFALVEKLLETIVQHICSRAKEFYSSDSIMANKCDVNVFLSLIRGPCAINYSSTIHKDSYWLNLHANELIERQRFTSITNQNQTIVYPENLNFIENKKIDKTIKRRIRNPSTLSDSSLTDNNVDSLYQTRKSTLLYGKNNVMLGDDQNSLGYFELISSTNDLLLKWTSNDLLLQASYGNVYHCHDNDNNNEYNIDQKMSNDSMYESNNPEVPDQYLNSQSSQLMKNNKRVDYGFHLGILSVSMKKIEYVHLHQGKPDKYASSEYCIILIGFDGIPHPPIRLHGGFNAVYNFLICLDQGLQPNACLNPSTTELDKVIEKDQIPTNQQSDVFIEQDSKHVQVNSSTEPTDDNELRQTDTIDNQNNPISEEEASINPMNIIVTIKLQLVLRTFKAWFTYTHHMNNVRKLLSSLVIHSDVKCTSSFDQYEKLTKEKWNELFVNIPDKKNFDPRCIYECIYYGGCVSELRNEVWPYLLGVYNWTMSEEEKKTINENLKLHYNEKLKEWTKIKKIIRVMELNETKNTTLLSQVNNGQTADKLTPNSSCLIDYKESILKQFSHALDSVKKDVVRCDRNNCVYSKFDSHGDRNLATIERILLTYVWEYLDDEYTQGMCDIVAPLLALKLEHFNTTSSSSLRMNENPSINKQMDDNSKDLLNDIEIGTYILFKYLMENHLKKLFAKETATFYMDQKFDHIKSLIQVKILCIYDYIYT
ncbi:run and tbc1 domain containing, putative [Schistosoma mansoni]|uniref:run and tbc1 domain containing, putative n=1 Tax=Schistosoma mansoni TaxID=6183 RepID=UPI00022C8193|nr:run and tbc1 domain containing, putative [Schistosoma mansoni]|eukprot:XP_018645581.1 run and tbc1 domain containing, putative [Schistosoma mansoni]